VDSFKRDNKPRGSLKEGKFLEYLIDCFVFKLSFLQRITSRYTDHIKFSCLDQRVVMPTNYRYNDHDRSFCQGTVEMSQ
jgi:hypothetical protein